MCKECAGQGADSAAITLGTPLELAEEVVKLAKQGIDGGGTN